MNTTTDTKNPAIVAPLPPFTVQLRDLAQRLQLTDTQGAAYLGVPVTTYRKWHAGTRTPSAVAIRLLDVLGMIEALAPGMHAHLIPVAAQRGRPKSKMEKGPL
jgi:DNA-binding transcriptional regulator YiaG